MSRLRIYLTNLGKYNEGELVGEWVDLPISEDEFAEVLKRIGISDTPDENGIIYDEYFITDYESDIDGLSVDEYESLSRLNDLAEVLEDMDDNDIKIFEAAVEAGDADIDDLEDFDTDEFLFIPDINSDYELGEYNVEEFDRDPSTGTISQRLLEQYFDYSRYGEDFESDFDPWRWLEVSPDDDPETLEEIASNYGVDSIDDISALDYFGVDSYEDLGRILNEDGVSDDSYFDYEDYGRDIRTGDGGSYVSAGYIVRL